MPDGLTAEEMQSEHADALEPRESMMVLSPGSGGAFAGVATAGEMAAEPSPIDDTATIQSETGAE